MNRKTMLGAAALTFACMTGAALAAAPADDHTYGGAQSAQPGWISTIADQKLEAVDGSSLTLSSSESGLALVVTSPTGETQKNTYTLMNDKLGTISNGTGSGHLIGFFRTTDKGLEAQFADGHTEALTVNAAGGLSVMLKSPRDGSACMAWYPHGHAFSESERRVALAEYARRLGLDDAAKAAHASLSCEVVATPPKLAATPPAYQNGKQKIAANEAAKDKGLVPIIVRTSVVHAVDGAATVAPAIASAPKAATIIPVSTSSSAQRASLEAIEPGHGASDCLSVDNNGADLGFRNQCNFAVQFAYCLQNAQDPAATCDAGSRNGNVAANGFVSLLPDTNIKAADAEHDFRWVGCTGGADEVEAHLDRTDPPAGRCVRVTAS